MITEFHQRTIRRECDIIMAMCQSALEHCVRLDAKCLPEDNSQVGRIADNLRIAMFDAGVLRDINDKRKVTECKPDK
jgi:hypothetical protein